jgi:hypothetical protein
LLGLLARVRIGVQSKKAKKKAKETEIDLSRRSICS